MMAAWFFVVNDIAVDDTEIERVIVVKTVYLANDLFDHPIKISFGLSVVRIGCYYKTERHFFTQIVYFGGRQVSDTTSQ